MNRKPWVPEWMVSVAVLERRLLQHVIQHNRRVVDSSFAVWPLPNSPPLLPYLPLLARSLDPSDVPSADALAGWLRAQGFRGSDATVRRYLQHVRMTLPMTTTRTRLGGEVFPLAAPLHLRRSPRGWSVAQMFLGRDAHSRQRVQRLEATPPCPAAQLLPVLGEIGAMEEWEGTTPWAYLRLAAEAGEVDRKHLTIFLRHPDPGVRQQALEVLPLLRRAGSHAETLLSHLDGTQTGAPRPETADPERRP